MIIMLILISFFVFILLVILLILLFCNKRKKQNRNGITNNQKVHLEIGVLKNLLYAKFDYETDNIKNDNSNT